MASLALSLRTLRRQRPNLSSRPLCSHQRHLPLFHCSCTTTTTTTTAFHTHGHFLRPSQEESDSKKEGKGKKKQKRQKNLLQEDKRVERLNDLAAFCKRRGFIYQSSAFYGGLSGSFDYGPIGVQLKKNVRDMWWRDFVELRRDVVGVETPIILHRKVWEASGHIDNFVDPMVECTTCKRRLRADSLLKDHWRQKRDMANVGEEEQVGEEIVPSDPETLERLFCEDPPMCTCGQKMQTWSDVRQFNLLFKTNYGPLESSSHGSAADAPSSEVFLRPETAQGIFINFSNVVTTSRKKLPLGIAQTGRAFRNEISPRDFIFRTREFEQMEMEYFCHPDLAPQYFDHWTKFCHDWLLKYGMRAENIHLHNYSDDDCAHYAVQTTDIEYRFPFGWGELWGIANRTDYDLRAHNKYSKKGKDFLYTDPVTKDKYMPHVIEPSVGLDRLVLAFLADAYNIEKVNEDASNERVVLKLHKRLAPYKFAVFPLLKREPLMECAEQLFDRLSVKISTDFDTGSSIGQLYRRHDEIGTPFCVTVDHQTLEDNSVTVRDRDTMQQFRISMDELLNTCHTMIENSNWSIQAEPTQ